MGERRVAQQRREALRVQVPHLHARPPRPRERSDPRALGLLETAPEAADVCGAGEHHQLSRIAHPLAGPPHEVRHPRLAPFVLRAAAARRGARDEVEVGVRGHPEQRVRVGDRVAVALGVREIRVDQEARAAALAGPAQRLGERLARGGDPDQRLLVVVLGEDERDARQAVGGGQRALGQRRRELDRDRVRVEAVEHRAHQRRALERLVHHRQESDARRHAGRDALGRERGAAHRPSSSSRSSSSTASASARVTASRASSASRRWSTFIA
ncbi:MAG: hypothetical protein M5U13_12475 [Thermoanaerobaculia bacterium]|nr:hypothetical protein [Thermoanaerobaculia bacterium]